jgi:hypothetical protein
MDSENNLMLVVIVALLLLIFVVSNKRRYGRRGEKRQMRMEGLDNVRAANATHRRDALNGSYNPRLIQPQIAEQVIDDNFIPLPDKVDYPWSQNGGSSPYGETDILEDGAMGNLSMSFNMFSKACCSSQWPTPHSLSPDDFVLMSDKEFVASPYTGNNGWQDSGCACLTKEQSRFLRHRGNNGGAGDL